MLQRGKSAEALQLVQSAAADLSAADTILLARLAALECRAYLPQSRYDEAERTARRAIALTDQFAEYMPQIADDVRARAERTLGWVAYTRQPEDPQALTHFRRALEATRRAGLRVIEAATLSNIGVALVERGQLDDGLRNYEEGLAVAESLGDSYSAAATLHNISLIYYLRGQLETALQGLEQVCDIERRIGDLNGLLSSENARADTLVALGRLDEARTVLDRVLADNQVTGDTWTLGS